MSGLHEPTRLLVKLCGLRTEVGVAAAVDADADLVGLNFAPRSRRCISLDLGRTLAAMLPAEMGVAVFQDASIEDILKTIDATGLHTVQLHGHVADGTFAALPAHISVVRAGASVPVQRPHPRVTAWLLDSSTPGSGTLRTAPFPGERLFGRPVLLAGGLDPDNVARAIFTHRPAGVDVASGLEGPDRSPCPARICAFVTAARTAASEAP